MTRATPIRGTNRAFQSNRFRFCTCAPSRWARIRNHCVFCVFCRYKNSLHLHIPQLLDLSHYQRPRAPLCSTHFLSADATQGGGAACEFHPPEVPRCNPRGFRCLCNTPSRNPLILNRLCKYRGEGVCISLSSAIELRLFGPPASPAEDRMLYFFGEEK